jgi:hypothetical protein
MLARFLCTVWSAYRSRSEELPRRQIMQAKSTRYTGFKALVIVIALWNVGTAAVARVDSDGYILGS